MPANNHSPLVAMIANYPKGTGYAWWLMERFWNEIAIAAVTQGWQSIIIYPENAIDNNTEQLLDNPNRLESFLSKGGVRDIMEVYLLIRHLNIRSIYLTDRPFRSWKYFLLRLSGVQSIVVHDHTPGDRPPITGIKGLIKRLLNLTPGITASLFIAISPLMRQRHLLNARIPSSRSVTVTNGIVVRDLVPNAREFLLNKFKLASDCYIVCVVGRLTPYKRVDFAIRCIDELAHEDPDSKPVLILVGGGPDRVRLEGIAGTLRSANCKVIFAGQVEDVWSILCGVDCVMHPSAGEGLSLAILEAMAAAQPVVVPSLPSVSQTIEHSSNGLIYQEGSLDDATRVLHDISSNNTLRTLLGMNARRKVVEKYQLNRAIKDFNTTAIPVILSIGQKHT